jgi:hypothetical protein
VTGGSSSGSISGAVDILLLDPANADRRPAGAAGAGATKQVAVGKLYLSSGATGLTGTWQSDGSYQLDGGGYSFSGDTAGAATTGTFTGPDGAKGGFSGQDSTEAKSSRFCGTYEGSAGGNWDFVISDSGALSGSFSGDASGALEGSVSGDAVNLTWSGTSFLGDAASGQASGKISSSTVTGTWSGDAGGAVSGTWTSDATCPGPQEGPEIAKDANCPCDKSPLPAGGACCNGGPFGSYCCSSIF